MTPTAKPADTVDAIRACDEWQATLFDPNISPGERYAFIQGYMRRPPTVSVDLRALTQEAFERQKARGIQETPMIVDRDAAIDLVVNELYLQGHGCISRRVRQLLAEGKGTE